LKAIEGRAKLLLPFAPLCILQKFIEFLAGFVGVCTEPLARQVHAVELVITTKTQFGLALDLREDSVLEID
jgi:hypothetical protein